MGKTGYRDRLGVEAAIDVYFVTDRSGVTDYAIVLLAHEDGAWVAVRVYDNNGNHDMHRYNRDGVKQAAETFHRAPRRFTGARRVRPCGAPFKRCAAATTR